MRRNFVSLPEIPKTGIRGNGVSRSPLQSPIQPIPPTNRNPRPIAQKPIKIIIPTHLTQIQIHRLPFLVQPIDRSFNLPQHRRLPRLRRPNQRHTTPTIQHLKHPIDQPRSRKTAAHHPPHYSRLHQERSPPQSTHQQPEELHHNLKTKLFIE